MTSGSLTAESAEAAEKRKVVYLSQMSSSVTGTGSSAKRSMENQGYFEGVGVVYFRGDGAV